MRHAPASLFLAIGLACCSTTPSFEHADPRPREVSSADAAPEISAVAALIESTPPPVEALVEPVVDARSRPEKQWDHIVAASHPDCRETLAATGAKFQPLPDVKKPNARGCGIPRGVLLTTGPTGIKYSPPVSIDCSLALALEHVEKIVQEEALAILEQPIVKMNTLGSFACRKVIGRLAGWSPGISEHALGNAVDVSGFQPKKGPVASLLRHYEPDAREPSTKEGRFLRNVQRRVRRELGLRALGPNFDASHRDHFHFDAGSPWWK